MHKTIKLITKINLLLGVNIQIIGVRNVALLSVVLMVHVQSFHSLHIFGKTWNIKNKIKKIK